MTAPAPHSPADIAPGMITYIVDRDAEPGDVVPALARLLIGVTRRRRARQQASAGGAQEVTEK